MKTKFSLEVTRALPKDECESAKILIREGLTDEAKKVLYRVLTQAPDHREAQSILKEIEDQELEKLLSDHASQRRTGGHPGYERRAEDPSNIIQSLEHDLGFVVNEVTPRFKKIEDLDQKTTQDVAIAYFEMECWSDALRELRAVEKKLRINSSVLDGDGVLISAMIAHCLLQLDQAYDAKTYLEPILVEPEVRYEDKIQLFYEMGRIEECMGKFALALEWYTRVMQIDPQFKDTDFRVRMIQRK